MDQPRANSSMALPRCDLRLFEEDIVVNLGCVGGAGSIAVQTAGSDVGSTGRAGVAAIGGVEKEGRESDHILTAVAVPAPGARIADGHAHHAPSIAFPAGDIFRIGSGGVVGIVRGATVQRVENLRSP